MLEPEEIPRGTYLTTAGAGEVAFNAESSHWLDADEFETEASSFVTRPVHDLARPEIRRLEQAAALYAGDLLEGFYDDWALAERERLRCLHLRSLSHVMRFYAQQREYQRSIEYAQKILRHDPLREHIHRDLMSFYLENGQRAQALKQYHECQQVLARELDIAPMEETQQLYQRILSGPSSGSGESFRSADRGAEIREAVKELREAMQSFERASRRLESAISEKMLRRIQAGRETR